MAVTQLQNIIQYSSPPHPRFTSGIRPIKHKTTKNRGCISPVPKTHLIALTESWKGDSVAKSSVCVCMLVNMCIFSVLIWLCSQMTVPLYNMTLKCAKCGVISSADLSTTATSNAMLVLLITYQFSTARHSVFLFLSCLFLTSLFFGSGFLLIHSPLPFGSSPRGSLRETPPCFMLGNTLKTLWYQSLWKC